MSKIWKMIKKLKGNNKESIKHITKENGTIAETEKEIANEIAKTLSDKSSNRNYNDKFATIKNNEEKQKIDFSSTNEESYNQIFTINEIKTCLSELKIQQQAQTK